MSRGRIHTQVADLLDRAVSEDIDLIAVGSRKDVAGDLAAALPRASRAPTAG
jgi:hypothetical protein